jgi:hypothetical protein
MGYIPGNNRKHYEKKKNLVNYIWERDLDEDLSRIRSYFNVSLVISLVKESEYSNHCQGLPFETIRDAYHLHDLDLIMYPMKKDEHPTDIKTYHQLMELITATLSKGKNVLLVCTGGFGRSSLVAAGCMIYNEISEHTVMENITIRDKNVLNKPNQKQFISEYVLYANIPIGKDSRSNSSGSENISTKVDNLFGRSLKYGLEKRNSSDDLVSSRNGIPRHLLKNPEGSKKNFEEFHNSMDIDQLTLNLTTEHGSLQKELNDSLSKIEDSLMRINMDYIYEREFDKVPDKKSHERVVTSYKDEVLARANYAAVNNAASF